MNDTGTHLRKPRVTFWAIAIAAAVSAVALFLPSTESIQTTAITAETTDTQTARIEPAASARGDTIPAAWEIKPSPVIEPDPAFFIGAGDGSNGYYAGRPAR